LTLPDGAVLEINAGSTGVPIVRLDDFTYRWVMRDKTSGQVGLLLLLLVVVLQVVVVVVVVVVLQLVVEQGVGSGMV
jgi:hypothetical protein